ncbi:MAG: hypothetical protein ACPGAK_03860 [Bacteroidia bacterium]
MNNDPLEHIVQNLKTHEVSPSASASFDEVMRRREKRKKGIIWWFTSAALLLMVGGMYVGLWPSQENNTSAVQKNTSNPGASVQSETYKPSSLNKRSLDAEEQNITNPTPESQVSTFADNEPKKSNKKTLGAKLFNIFNKLRGNGDTDITPTNTGITRQYSESSKFPKGLMTSVLKEEPALYGKRYLEPTKPGEPLEMRPSDYLDWDFNMGPFEPHLRKKPWYVELSAITGSNNQVQFNEEEPLSVLGTNYMAQYQASFLTSFNSSSAMWGIGLHYTQWVGNGEWREHTKERILQPDGTYKIINSTTTGRVNYSIDKVSIPLSYRGFARVSKFNLRYGVQLAPGFTSVTEGTYFDATSYTALQNSRMWSMDGKASVGPMIQVNKGLNVVIEPSVMYQSFVDQNSKIQGNWFGGLGVSMLYRLR